jgi:O-antigen/teichoic acid export membrane protein
MSQLNPRHILRNVAIPTIEFGWLTVLSFITIPIIVHKLGVEIYGVWLLCMSVSGILSQLLDPGMGPASVKYLSEPQNQSDPDVVASIVGTTLFVNLVVSTVICVGIWVGANFIVQQILRFPPEIQSDAYVLLLASGVILVINYVGNTYASVLQACQRVDLFSGWSIVFSTLSTGLTIALLYLGAGIWSLLVSTTLSSLARLLIQMCISRRLLPTSVPWRLKVRLREFRRVVGYGSVFFAFTTLDTVFWQGQRFLIGTLLGPAAVSYYAVPQSATQRLHMLVAKASTILLPLNSALTSSGDLSALQRLYKRSATLGAIISFSLAVPVVPLAPAIMRLWMGSEFAANSNNALSILAISYLLLAITVVPSQYLFGAGLARVGLLLLGMAVIAYIPLAVYLTLSLAVRGAALALFFSYLGAVPLAIFSVEQRLLRMNFLDSVRIYLPPLVAASLCFLGLDVLGIVHILGNIVQLLLWYCVSAVAIAISSLLIGRLLHDDLLSYVIKLIQGRNH